MSGQHKIIFTGPVGAGKTTAINTISDIETIKTEQVATDEVAQKKEFTTVAMDYGLMRMDNGEVIHLYGTPGQERFEFMWNILTEGAIGLIILLDHNDPDPLSYLDGFLKSFKDFINKTSVVVGVSRLMHATKDDLDKYRSKLREHKLTGAVYEADPREHDDVVMLIQTLLFSLDQSIEAETA